MKAQSLTTLCASSLLAVSACQPTTDTNNNSPVPLPAKPNVVFIMCDDLGWGDLGCYGHPVIKTPCLDSLSQNSIKFNNYYSAAPVCSPARAGLLTGKVPSRTGIYTWIPNKSSNMHLQAQHTTLPALLQHNGYATGLFGKWHLNSYFNQPQVQPTPTQMGFDYWLATHNNAHPNHHNPVNFVRNGQPQDTLQGYSCQIVATETLQWIDKQQKPFFALVTMHEPHSPIESPPHLVKQYPYVNLENEAQYFANVTNLDSAVGRIVRGLKKRNLWHNTILVFTSDNGPETLNRYSDAKRSYGTSGPHKGNKLWLHEGGIKVPCIVHLPGSVLQGQTTNRRFWAPDWLPTLAHLTQTPLPAQLTIDGQDVHKFLTQNQPVNRHKPLFWHYYRAFDNAEASMIVGNYKIIGFNDTIQLSPGGGLRGHDMKVIKHTRPYRFELYDLSTDPYETNNLAQQKPDILRQLRQQMEETLNDVLAQSPYWVVNSPAHRNDKPYQIIPLNTADTTPTQVGLPVE